jgi:anti-sigma factor RsiW
VRCAVRSSLGAFLLGALDPQEHDAVARHVATCPDCRREVERMAALPELLARVGAPTLADPPSLRRRGWNGALCLALLLALAGGALLGRDTLREEVHAANPATDVRMTAEISRMPRGTGVELYLSGVPEGEHCRLVVRSDDGRREVVSRWRASYEGRATVEAATSIAPGELAELSVVADDGRMLVRAAVG